METADVPARMDGSPLGQKDSPPALSVVRKQLDEVLPYACVTVPVQRGRSSVNS